MEPNTTAYHLKRLILHDAEQRFSVQKEKEGQYYPAPDILTGEDLTAHLAGEKTLGIKLIQPKTLHVRAGAVDLDAASSEQPDLEKTLGTARQIQTTAASLGIPTAVEFSGRRGWHVWVFLTDPIPAETMRRLLVSLTARAGCPDAELFPAGDKITEDGSKGSGSKPIKLPCGLHQVSGHRSGFVGEEITWGEDGLPVLPEQAPLLAAMQQTSRDKVLAALPPIAPETEQQPSAERVPDLSRLGDAEPACIAWLRKHGAPDDQTYNQTNTTLARYAISRGLGDDAALLLAEDVAQHTRPEHHTEKKTPQDKIQNFQSVLRTAQQDPSRYAFDCSYVRGSKEIRVGGCPGSGCPAWPYRTDEPLPPKQATPTDTLIEREALAFLAAHPDEALAPVLHQQIPPEAFLTRLGPEGEEPRHQNVWRAILALAGREIRPSTILVQWEAEQGSPITPEQDHWLDDLFKVPLCTLATFETHLERLRDTGLREVLLRGLRDAGEMLKLGEDLPITLDTLITSSQQLQKRGAASLLPMEEMTGGILQDLLTRPPMQIATPSAWLNDALNGGWLPGRFYVVGAPPGSGKTTLCAWAADYAASLGTPVLYVSFEMSREQLFIYALAREGGINSALIERQRWKDAGYTGADALAGQIKQAHMKYTEKIAPWMTIMEAGPEATPAYLKGAVGQVRAQAGLDDSAPVLLVIDYLQCMSTGDEALDNGTNETQKASRLATALKQLARDTGVAVIAISDITKQAYTEGLKSGELNMGAFRDSFKISHAADTILLLLSEDYQPSSRNATPPPPPQSQLQLVKGRLVAGSSRDRALDQVERDHPLDSRLRASYARLAILKNRGGRPAEPLFVYERAYHRFTSIEVDARAWEDEEDL